MEFQSRWISSQFESSPCSPDYQPSPYCVTPVLFPLLTTASYRSRKTFEMQLFSSLVTSTVLGMAEVHSTGTCGPPTLTIAPRPSIQRIRTRVARPRGRILGALVQHPFHRARRRIHEGGRRVLVRPDPVRNCSWTAGLPTNDVRRNWR
jgi:hypothetical protein